VRRRGVDDRVHARELAGGRLHDAHRDDVGALVDRPREVGHRDALDLDAATLGEEGPQQRRELGSLETTRAPSGSAAAAKPTMLEVFAPIATRSTGTFTIRAKEARPRSVYSPQPSQLVRPPRQSPSTD